MYEDKVIAHEIVSHRVHQGEVVTIRVEVHILVVSCNVRLPEVGIALCAVHTRLVVL